MSAETINAREWVLVPREPSAGMWDAAESAMVESECAYNAGDPAARSDAHGFPTMRIWQAVVGYRAMLAAAPQPPSTPVGVRNAILEALNLVHAEGRARVESATAEMADRLAALAQQPVADKFVATFRCESSGIVGHKNAPIHSVSMHDDGVIEVVIDHWPEQPATARGDARAGEVFGWVLGNAFVDARFWTGDTPPQGWTPVYCTAPTSASVGVEVASLPALWRQREDNGEEHTEYDKGFETASDECARMLEAALAQQPAADPLEEWANRPLNFTATVGEFEDGVVGKQPAAVDEAVRLLREYREAPKFSNDHDAIKRTVALEDEIDAFLAALNPIDEQEGKESFWPKLPGSGGPDWTGHD